jgi:phosphatidylserine/phosphatidylglycerophosphate/cardiolipin synthase-like enzyme
MRGLVAAVCPKMLRPRFSYIFALAVFLLSTGPVAPASAQTPPLAPQERMCDPAFQDCRADILTYIQQETVAIDMGYWMMTDARYSNALVAAAQRGVKIRLLMDPNCADQHPACVAQNDQLRAAGIPMRRRQAGGILHWKAIIFVGQGQLEFAGANYAPFEMSPEIPFVNYTDEVVAFTNDPSLVHSFMTKFDDMWVSDAEFVNYANVVEPSKRNFPTYAIDPELNFPPDEGYRNRAVAAYDAEPTKIDVQMFRITDGAHPDAMLRALARGVPVRLITDETEYRNTLRLMDAYYVDLMWASGVDVRFDGHDGIDHEKAIALYGTGMSIVGSSNWTDASDASQREHNYFTRKPWVFDWLTAQFERKWNNQSGYAETKPFVPLPPDAPSYNSPAAGQTGVPVNGAALAWAAGYWAHKYDIYFGTDPNPPLLAADRQLGPSQSSGDYKVFALPVLRPGTTYYWRVVSKTMANKTAGGSVRSFTTAGTAPPANARPSVTLTSPSAGTIVAAGSPVNLSATANDTDGAIARVDFFAGTTLVGSATSAPYTATWLKPAVGSYTLTAVATDDGFASATSTGVSVTVGAAAGPVTRIRGPYLQQPTDHSVVVVWATREPGPAQVRYGAAATSTRIAVPATSRLIPATVTGFAFDYYQHTATLAGLAADTAYGYQPLLSDTPVTPESTFKTAPRNGSGAISFVALGDSGTGSPEQRQISDLIGRDSFDFALHVGDIVYGSTDGTGDASYTTYQSYLFDIDSWLPSHAFVPVEGNHDSRPSNGNGLAYLDLFELPRNGANAAFPDHAERYYSFDYGPVHFVALDTEFTFLDPARQAEQLRWLAADLASTTQPWKIAFLHRAPYSSGGEHGSSPDVRAAFGPLFERYGVDLVLAGHEHTYERTVPIRESTVTTDTFVTYVVTGGGGAPLYPSGTSAWTAFSASRNEYVKVAVDACTLTINAIGLDGAAFDTTSVAKCVPGNKAPTVALTSPANGSTFTAPASFTLTAAAADADGSVTKVDFYAGATLLGSTTTAPYSIAVSDLAAGTYSLKAVATDDAAATTASAAISITVNPAAPPSTLPAGWSRADVGATGAPGSAGATGNTFTVAGAGADVWGTADALHYAYRTLDGDGTIVARVSSIQLVNNWTKAGVMIRNSLSPSAAQAFMLVAASATKGVPFQRRLADGGSSVSTSGSQSTAPRWVKLVRTGNTIAGYESADGVAWTLVASDTFALTPSVLVGLAVSSHVAGTTATAVFDNVTVTAAGSPPPNVPPAVSMTSPANGATFTAPATMTLTAAASDTDGTVAKVDFYAGTTLLGTVTAAPYSLAWSGVPAGTYSLTAVATDSAGAATTSAAVSVTVDSPVPPSSSLPAGWSHADIGTVGATGNASAASGTFTVSGAGADVWGTADALHYAYRTLDGDGTIVARVSSIQVINSWTKAGVMIRNSLSPSAAQAFMLVAASASKGVPFQRRLADGNSSVSTSGSQSTAPRWVKLVRTGTTIAGYESADGLSWTLVASDSFAMSSSVLVGLAVSSHVTGTNATAVFDNVTVTGTGTTPPANVSPTVSLTSPAGGTHFTAPASIAISASATDSDGTVAKVDFFAGTTLIGTATTAPYAVTWTSVPAGTYSLTAVATDNAGAATTSAASSVTVDAQPPATGLPAGWTHADVGAVGATGSATAAGGSFTVSGAGADVWGTADAFHYAYRTLDGDGTIVARVSSIQLVNNWTKAGVMIRNSLSPSAAQAFMLVAASPTKGVPFQRRLADGNVSVSTAGSQSTAPRWIKLVRAGNTISGYESADGVAWTLVASDTFAMTPSVLVGIAVSSHVAGTNATAVFDNLTVTGAGGGD